MNLTNKELNEAIADTEARIKLCGTAQARYNILHKHFEALLAERQRRAEVRMHYTHPAPTDEQIDAAADAVDRTLGIRVSRHRAEQIAKAAVCAAWGVKLEAAKQQLGWVCGKCGTDRTKAACPKGHSAALTGDCPMAVPSAQAEQATSQPPAQGSGS